MTTPCSRISPTLLLLAATFAVPVTTTAQDQFGLSVAVGSGEALVMKAFAGRGPAAVFVFRRADDGTWQVDQQIQPAVASETGEGFGTRVTSQIATYPMSGVRFVLLHADCTEATR